MFPGERQGSFVPKLVAERKGLWDIFILKQQQHHCYLHSKMIVLKSLTDSVPIHFNFNFVKKKCVECALSVLQILIVYLKAELVDIIITNIKLNMNIKYEINALKKG